MLSRRTVLLKPMCPSASGYVRLQSENGCTLVQLHARGLEAGEKRLFAALNGQSAQEVACGWVKGNGELSLEGECGENPQSLLLVGADGPVLIGLTGRQDAGALLQAKTAALSLAQQLRRPAPKPEAKPEPAPPVKPETPKLPREIFLPAIDPAPYLAAAAKPVPDPPPVLPPPRPNGPEADRLKPLRWPNGFETLADAFSRHAPVRLFDAPGWRFVQAAKGLWIGYLSQDGQVIRLAYAIKGRTPPAVPGHFHPVQGIGGEWYQVMWQAI